MVLLLGGFKERVDTRLQSFVQLPDDLIGARVIEIDVFLCLVELCSGVGRAQSKRVDCSSFYTLTRMPSISLRRIMPGVFALS